MKYLDYKVMNAEEYVNNKISREMDKYLQKLYVGNNNSRIVWCIFDKSSFDKKLKRDVKRIYGAELDIETCWCEIIKKLPTVYMQQDFLEDAYRVRFKMFGKNRDYGAIIFYGINVQDQTKDVKELIARWFDFAIKARYRFEKEKYDKFSFLHKKPFEFCIRWRPIADVVMYFDENISLENVRNQILKLAEIERIVVKSADDCMVFFE